ncbi:MAG: TetR/AcrR family transcriptional regulator [Deltaproteobacteria bacterium]|jgi:TetR/AcrR family fatty acid metabolism transcriptional regulator|nr:TetR/AcrR family transcriptional regulator [Deltaproteobacteria bacterium]
MKNENKHQKILKAAIKVFAEKGFYNSRVAEIAKEANVADGTIYLYFKNKDDILISLFEEEFGQIVENTRKELEKEKDPLQKIRRFAITHLSIVFKQQQLGEVLGVEVRQSSKFMKEYINKPFIEYLNLIRSIVIEGQERGLIRKDLTPGIMKRALFGALDEMARYWVLSAKKKHSINEAALQISDVFIRGMMSEEAQKNYPWPS